MSPPLCFICRLSEWTVKSKKKNPGRCNKQYGETIKCHPVELNVLKSQTFTQLGHLLQVWLRFPYSMFYAFDWLSAPDKMSYFYTYIYFSAGLDGDSIIHPSPAASTCTWDITRQANSYIIINFFRPLKTWAFRKLLPVWRIWKTKTLLCCKDTGNLFWWTLPSYLFDIVLFSSGD